MKAIRADRFGGPEELKLVETAEPKPAAGQVRIRVHSAGVNPADLVRLSGMFPGLALPYIPGTDVSGEIDAVGEGVDQSRVGERVYGRALTGGYAEKTCLLASEAIPLPSNLSFAEGSGIPIPFFTAYHALHNKAVASARGDRLDFRCWRRRGRGRHSVGQAGRSAVDYDLRLSREVRSSCPFGPRCRGKLSRTRLRRGSEQIH